jgi:uncharacterized protein
MKQNIFFKVLIQSETKISTAKLSLYLLIYFLTLFLNFIHLQNRDTIFHYQLLYYLIGITIFTIILPKYFLKLKIIPVLNKKRIVRNILFSIIILIIISAVAMTLYESIATSNSLFYDNLPTAEFILRIFLLILIGYTEEYIFRKIFFKQTIFQTKNVLVANIIISLLFSFVHVPKIISIDYSFSELLLKLFFIFIISFLLSDIYYLTNSLIIVVMLHCLIDTNGIISPEPVYASATIIIMILLPLILRILNWQKQI